MGRARTGAGSAAGHPDRIGHATAAGSSGALSSLRICSKIRVELPQREQVELRDRLRRDVELLDYRAAAVRRSSAAIPVARSAASQSSRGLKHLDRIVARTAAYAGTNQRRLQAGVAARLAAEERERLLPR